MFTDLNRFPTLQTTREKRRNLKPKIPQRRVNPEVSLNTRRITFNYRALSCQCRFKTWIQNLQRSPPFGEGFGAAFRVA